MSVCSTPSTGYGLIHSKKHFKTPPAEHFKYHQPNEQNKNTNFGIYVITLRLDIKAELCYLRLLFVDAASQLQILYSIIDGLRE